MTKIVLLLRFYLTVCLPNLIITWVITQKLIEFGMGYLKIFIILKVMSLLVLLFFRDLSAKKTYVYYANLGLTRIPLLGYTFVVDMLLFFILLIISFKLC